MEFFDAARLRELLTWPELIDAIGEILGEHDAVSPPRHMHPVGVDGSADDVLLLKPAWIPGKLIGVKTVTSFGSNTARGLGTVNASYLLLDGETGVPIAVMDGEALGSRRTMGASALAARSLARADAHRLLVVGTGQLAPHAVAAHCAVRPISHVEVWGRDSAKAESVVESVVADLADVTSDAVHVEVSTDLDASAADADIVSCVTSSTTPLIRGALLRPGTHLDLVGSFTADMRESDDACVQRGTVFVDALEGALVSGDISQPIEAGVIDADDLVADLRALATGAHAGRSSDDEITVFKSAGFALEDLAAARLAWTHRSTSTGSTL